MDRHPAQHHTSQSFNASRQNDTETERELLAAIQRELLIRFLKTNALQHVHDQSLIRFVSDTVDITILQNDAEYRGWLLRQGVDADNFHATTKEGQVLLHTIINQWVMDQT